jgi:predicted ATPase/class 3 adenylate cyclase/DNA-binding CsgD family transcriptional regulator
MSDAKLSLAGSEPLPAPALLPEGVVTFLLTDIEASTQHWEEHPGLMQVAMETHDEILSMAVEASDGIRPLEQGEGDSAVVAFAEASRALACALDLQRGLAAAEWPDGCELRVRCALHSGEALKRDPRNYVGPALNRCARLRASAFGGQTLISRATHELVIDTLPEDANLRPLGRLRLRGMSRSEEVFELVHPELRSGFPPPPSRASVSGNLPVELTSFVGREQELADVREHLSDHRLITLIGAGGCGKTRLALRVAAEAGEGFTDGAWWVDLAPIFDEELVGAAIAEAMAVRPLPGVTHLEAAAAYLGGKSALVVLDNCEHLLDAAAAAAEMLLLAGPEVVVMATSRAPLEAHGEVAWRVPSLSLGEPGAESSTESDAARLFIERAGEVMPGLDLDGADRGTIVRICSELDGMPLAIELAAARLRVLSLVQIADGLADRFRTLGAGPRTETPRLRTLRASVEWSHGLLSEDQRTLLRRLAVFVGGFKLAYAEEVCAGDGLPEAELLALLSSLVDQSLVDAIDEGSAFRYRLLETVREYGLERLAEAGEEEEIRTHHRDAFLALAETAGPKLETAHQVEGLELLDPEVGNLAAAIDFALRTEPARALRLCIAAHRWWAIRGRYLEAELAFTRSLETGSEVEAGLRARAYEARAYVKVWTAEFEAAAADATEALALADADDQSTAARARCSLAIATSYGDPRSGRAEAKRAAELATEAGDSWALVAAKQLVGLTHYFEADHPEALRALLEVTDLADDVGDPFLIARRWLFQGLIAQTDGRSEEARDTVAHLHRALEATGDPVLEAYADFVIGWIDANQGEPDRALERLEGRLESTLKDGAVLPVPALYYGIGQAELAADRPERVPGRLGPLVEMIETRDALGTSLNLYVIADALRLLGEDGAAEAATRVRGAAERLGNSAYDGLARLILGRIAAAGGDWTSAREHARAHLDVTAAEGHKLWAPSGLDALAEAAAGLGDHREAVRLFAAADRARADLGTVRVPPEVDHWTAIESRLRSELGDQVYEAARAEGAELSFEQALEWARRGRGPRSRPAGGWESLTPTETRVAELVADGLTNPTIAERMFVSTTTVKTHVAHIFKKLDVHNRAELSGLWARRAPADDT